MVKAILFDFWGTLVENGIHPSPVNQVKYILRLRMSFREFVTRFEDSMMRKEYADLNEAFTAVCNEFKIRPDPYIIEKLVGMWNKNEFLGKPFFESLEMLEYLKDKGFKLILVSNTNQTIHRVLDKYDMHKYFDEEMFSYKEGLLKTDPELFHRAIKKMKLKEEDVVMIGDSLQTDIFGARAANVKAILLDRMNKRDYSPKIRNLRELKELVEKDKLKEFASQVPTEIRDDNE